MMARKITDGKIRNKERTKIKMLNAVGEIIQTEGYTKLGVNNIARKADVSKKLIYLYFGTAENLIETYVKRKDYWMSFKWSTDDLIEKHRHNFGQDLAADMLEKLFMHLTEVPELQKLLVWELSGKNKIMREVSELREKIGDELFRMVEPLFEGTIVDIRAVYALLLGGLYYMTIHANSTGGTYCGIDIKNPEGSKQIMEAIKMILKWAFENAKLQQSFA